MGGMGGGGGREVEDLTPFGVWYVHFLNPMQRMRSEGLCDCSWPLAILYLSN